MNKIHPQLFNFINISLIADEETLKKRLLKDIEEGVRTEDIIKRSLDRLPMYDHLNTIKINTKDKIVDKIIEEILRIR